MFLSLLQYIQYNFYYSLILLNTFFNTILSVLLLPWLCSRRSTEMFNGKIYLENAIYSCSCKNTSVLRLIPTCSTNCSWDLLMVMAKVSLTGNWSLLSGTNSVFVLGNSLILGINITFSVNLLFLLIILHWSTFLLTFNTTILVPLQSPSPGPKFLSKITEQPTLRQSKTGNNPLVLSC